MLLLRAQYLFSGKAVSVPLNTDGLLLSIQYPVAIEPLPVSVFLSPPPRPPPPPNVDDLSHTGRLYGSHIPAVKWSRRSRAVCRDAEEEARQGAHTPKKGKLCHLMQRAVFMLCRAFLVRTLLGSGLQ